MGLTITVNSYDPPLFGTTLTDEYRLLATEFGYDPEGLVRITRNAFTAALCDQALRHSLLDEFDTWARSQHGDMWANPHQDASPSRSTSTRYRTPDDKSSSTLSGEVEGLRHGSTPRFDASDDSGPAMATLHIHERGEESLPTVTMRTGGLSCR